MWTTNMTHEFYELILKSISHVIVIWNHFNGRLLHYVKLMGQHCVGYTNDNTEGNPTSDNVIEIWQAQIILDLNNNQEFFLQFKFKRNIYLFYSFSKPHSKWSNYQKYKKINIIL